MALWLELDHSSNGEHLQKRRLPSGCPSYREMSYVKEDTRHWRIKASWCPLMTSFFEEGFSWVCLVLVLGHSLLSSCCFAIIYLTILNAEMKALFLAVSVQVNSIWNTKTKKTFRVPLESDKLIKVHLSHVISIEGNTTNWLLCRNSVSTGKICFAQCLWSKLPFRGSHFIPCQTECTSPHIQRPNKVSVTIYSKKKLEFLHYYRAYTSLTSYYFPFYGILLLLYEIPLGAMVIRTGRLNYASPK